LGEFFFNSYIKNLKKKTKKKTPSLGEFSKPSLGSSQNLAKFCPHEFALKKKKGQKTGTGFLKLFFT